MIAMWTDIATAAPAAFLLGLFAGWIISQRYAIVRKDYGRRHYDKPGNGQRQPDDP